MDKSVYVRRSITELRKMLVHKFLYDYRKPKYEEKTKCCSFLILRSFISFSMSELFILLKENDSGVMLIFVDCFYNGSCDVTLLFYNRWIVIYL